MTTLLEKFNKEQLKTLPELMPGDTIKVHQKIKDGDPSTGSGQVKERIQIFEGVIIAKKHGVGISATITVRKVVDGIGVEKVFPMHSTSIDKIEVLSHGKVRRAKLYYLKKAKGKKARLKRKEFASVIAPEAASDEASLAPEGREPAEEPTPETLAENIAQS